MRNRSHRPQGDPPSSDGRIEDDFVEPLKPAGVPHRHLPAALPFAIAGVLLVSAVAFGANVAHNMTTPTSTTTAVLTAVGHPVDAPQPTPTLTVAVPAHHEPASSQPADPTPTPKPKPVKTPAPTRSPSDLGGLKVKKNSNGTYTFSWSAYKGSKSFDYYKLDGQPYPNKPGYVENDGDYLACLDPGTTSATISLDPGTWNLNVEAVRLGDGNPVAVARTSVLKLTVAKPTPPKVLSLSLTATVDADGNVELNWSKYTGPYFEYYGIVRADGSDAPVLKPGETPDVYFDSVGTTSWTDDGTSDLGPLVSGQTYTYRVYAYTEQTFGDVSEACQVGTILAVSDPETVVIP